MKFVDATLFGGFGRRFYASRGLCGRRRRHAVRPQRLKNKMHGVPTVGRRQLGDSHLSTQSGGAGEPERSAAEADTSRASVLFKRAKNCITAQQSVFPCPHQAYPY